MPNFASEILFKKPVIGIDEVGRGSLAGPVVSCACIFFDYFIPKYKLSLLDDSKKLTHKKRLKALKLIFELKRNNIIKFALGYASVEEIDAINILEATKLSIRRSVYKLNYFKGNIIVDGNLDLHLNNFTCKNIIKGDQKSTTIATASIIAKVHRDRYMVKIGRKFPHYNWHRNAGYGTKEHIEQIYSKGLTLHHRKSFKPAKYLSIDNDSKC